MSARAGQRTRPLGSVRQTPRRDSVHSHPSKVNIPAQPTQRNPVYVGVQGSAMTLPTPRPTSEVRRKSMPACARDGECRCAEVSHEACEKEKKSLMDREAHLKEQVQHLKKEIEKLTAALKQKETAIQTLTSENSALKSSHEAVLKAEREKQTRTQEELESLRGQLQATLTQLQTQEESAKAQLQQLQKDMVDMMAAKDREIAEREQAVEKLKKQIAEMMKGGSLERQQQLAELGQELMALRKESDGLRNSLKTLSNKPKECGKCAESVARAEKLAMTLKERDVTIGQLKSLCTRFETQLSQQDLLLKQWADSKGHHVQLP